MTHHVVALTRNSTRLGNPSSAENFKQGCRIEDLVQDAELEMADAAKTDDAKGLDKPPHNVIVGRKEFDDEVMFRAQQPGPSKSKAGKNKKKFRLQKEVFEQAKAREESNGAEHAEQKWFLLSQRYNQRRNMYDSTSI